MKIKRIFATAAAVILSLLTLLISACGGTDTVKVTFDFNDGATEERVVEVERGSAVEKPAAPTRDGHIFGGWYFGGEEYNFAAPVNSDITLTAEWEVNEHTVTIIFYEGKQTVRVVSDGEKLSAPKTEEREGFTFEGWYLDESRTKKYNFNAPVKNDLTIYGNWIDESATYFDVTYNYNYENSTPSVVPVEQGKTASKPSPDPVRADYRFLGWFTSADGDIEYNFDTPITEATEIFAHWEQIIIEGVKNYVFEAELTDLSDFSGSGYSNEAEGRGAIQDEGKWSNVVDLTASNGYWVGYLYKTGCKLTFVIDSDRDISDVTLKIRLSGEIVNGITIKSNQFKITINDSVVRYNDIFIDDVPTSPGSPPRAFEDFELGANLSLKEGRNEIVLTVDNAVPLQGADGSLAGGKIQATAPLVDCIKITTAANLSWNPWFEGLEKKYGWDREIDYKGIVETEE